MKNGQAPSGNVQGGRRPRLSASGILSAIVDSTNDSIYSKTLDGRIASWNAAAARTFGWTAEEIVGQPVDILVPHDRLDEVPRFTATIAAGGQILNRETVRLTKDGRSVDVVLTISPVRDASGSVVGASVISRDLGEQRGLEARIREANDELKHRVADLEARSRELNLLAELGDLLQSCEEVDEAYAVIATIAGPLFAGDSGALYILSDTRSAAEAVATWGEQSPSRSVFAPADCWGLRRGRIHVVEEPVSGLVCPHAIEPNAMSYVCVPLNAQSETMGLLHLLVGRRGGRTKRAELLAERSSLAETVAEHAALALANFRLRATLKEQSTRDQLTGLYNRRYMEDSLDRELRRSARDDSPLGLLMLDLDHFKRVNDGFGHPAGDALLRTLGDFLRRSIRAEDIACRYGGEEFVVVMPNASLRDANRRAEALLHGVRSLSSEERGPWLSGITLSIGVAGSPRHGTTADTILAAADEALYRAKASGRNRVVVAGRRQRRATPVAVPIDPGQGFGGRAALGRPAAGTRAARGTSESPAETPAEPDWVAELTTIGEARRIAGGDPGV